MTTRQAKDLKPGCRIGVDFKGKTYKVKLTEVNTRNGVTLAWHNSIDQWKKGQECQFFNQDEQVQTFC
jgi:hypothetical protein